MVSRAGVDGTRYAVCGPRAGVRARVCAEDDWCGRWGSCRLRRRAVFASFLKRFRQAVALKGFPPENPEGGLLGEPRETLDGS